MEDNIGRKFYRGFIETWDYKCGNNTLPEEGIIYPD